MKGRIHLAAIAVVILGAAGWIFVDWFRSRDAVMSEAPSREATSAVLAPQESLVLANLRIGYPVIVDALNRAVDKASGTKSGRERAGCVEHSFARIRECLDVNWSITFGRSGAIEVGRNGSHLKIAVPGQFTGHAGFGGGLARILGLDRKNFSGSFVASVSASLSLDERFCPVLTPGNVDFRWTREGRVELVGRTGVRILNINFGFGPVNLDVGRHANGDIRKALTAALNKARNSIPCDPVRDQLARAWRNYAFPVSGDGMPSLFANIEPTSLGASGLLVDDGGVRLIIRMTANAVVASQKGSEEARADLPVNVSVRAEQGKLALAVPVKISYGALQNEAMKALFEQPLAVGDTRIKVEGVEIYPSNDRLAVGVKFSTSLPWRIFDATGVVWVTARPRMEDGGKVIRFEDVEVTRQLDSTLWSAVSLVLKDVLQQELQKAAVYDLTDASQKAVAAIAQSLSDPGRTAGFRFEIKDADLSLGRILPEADALAVEGLFSADLDAELVDVGI